VRNRLADFKVEIAEKAFKTGLVEYPAGSWILPDQKGLAEALKSTAAELGVDFESAAAVPDVPRHESRVPRLAVWHTWADTESVGWVRYVLDREKIPYSYIRDDDIRAGRLGDRFDIILFGHNYLGLQDQIQGIDKKYSPMPYTKTKETPSLGTPDATEDITGGIGWAGLANLEKYIADGGLFITLGNGSTLPLEGGLVRDVYQHAGFGAQGEIRTTRPSACLWLPGGHVGLPHGAARLRHRRLRPSGRRASVGHQAQDRGPRRNGERSGEDKRSQRAP
jgi:hypothetical protein